MELFHTSPSEITEINTLGRFGEFLFFSSNIYQMSADDVVTYKLSISDDEIIEAGSLLYHEDALKLQPLIKRVAKLAGCDEDTAEALLAQRADVSELEHIEPENLAELSWDIQALTGQAAKLLGYRGVSMQDEQGACYLIDMLGHESELERL